MEGESVSLEKGDRVGLMNVITVLCTAGVKERSELVCNVLVRVWTVPFRSG